MGQKIKNIILLSLLIQNLYCQQFKDVTNQVGFTNVIKSNGVSVVDYDLDGYLDVFIVAQEEYEQENPNTISRLFRNKGDGSFENVTSISGLDDFYIQFTEQIEGRSLGNKIGASWGDYNNDSYPDLFLSGVSLNHLFKNNGDGTFTEVTVDANLEQFCDTCITTTTLWFDYNNDGYLDLFLSDYSSLNSNKIYINKKDGTFNLLEETVINEKIGISYSSIPMDFNNDGLLDLYVANDFDGDNFLYIKNSIDFIESAENYNVLDPYDGMGLATSDFNNDGLFDLFVTNISQNGFYINKGHGFFLDESETHNVKDTQWSWGVIFSDFDNDGYEDLFIGNGSTNNKQPNYYFKNVNLNGERTFVDNSSELSGENLTVTKSIVDFDFDNDGDLDIIAGDFDGNLIFYKNTIDNQNKTWFKIILEGTESNINAFGSKINVKSYSLNQNRLFHGSRFLSQSITPIHFGLGNSSIVDEITVTWPSGVTETYNNIPANSTIKIKENNGYVIIDNLPINPELGCTDIFACNYSIDATVNNGSCTYIPSIMINGSTSSTPLNMETYSVFEQDFEEYIWSVENGTIIDGQGTNNIKVIWDIDTKGIVKLRVKDSDCYTQESIFDVSLNFSVSSLSSDSLSIARLWNEVLLELIRLDYARPTIHARNLFHTSMAMFDSWAIYNQDSSSTYLIGKTVNNFSVNFDSFNYDDNKNTAIAKTISYAMYNILKQRFKESPNLEESFSLLEITMSLLGYDPDYNETDYSNGKPEALGNFIAEKVIEYGLNDGSNEENLYVNNYYKSINPNLTPYETGNKLIQYPNRWQPLSLDVFIDQSGNVISDSSPEFLSPEWGNVFPFSLTNDDYKINTRGSDVYKTYLDPGAPAYITNDLNLSEYYKWGFSLVSIWSSHLTSNDGVMWDISPLSIGNFDIELLPNSFKDYSSFYKMFEGGDISTGRRINPVTNEEYVPNFVPRGDYTRVLAEFWADGPDSETPPGHWFTLLNYVSDSDMLDKRISGVGEIISDLEWDIKSYFILGGAMHDAAIAAWSIKGWYDYIRPISAIRYMAGLGQSTDETLSNYNVQGIPLIKGFIEVVSENDELAGDKNENVGKIKLYSWRGHDYITNVDTDIADVGWILAENWWPYQRPSFVTPPFAGYVSGHSTFSRTAAVVLTKLTGSEYFPGGIGKFTASKDKFLVFEEGPSEDVELQWATYYDASDQCSLSRIWGGIHPPVDDIIGRKIGNKIGEKAFEFAFKFFENDNIGITQNSLFPNPVSTGEKITISNTNLNDSFYLFDLIGKQINFKSIIYSEYSKSTELSLNHVGKGVYFIKHNDKSYKIIVK
ncbi:FG-GAP-like repeat-containing protein [uncultured Polaribacter sp.]|uniref:FG-GAP-like repeat-containing protein n=1 Tax=uncultured Polaribacter sp. TaxID=174711 RepID=UPI002602CCEC|nr:FG-GAP-like repeat-containing protein [uncultured Polaribacter sp.]